MSVSMADGSATTYEASPVPQSDPRFTNNAAPHEPTPSVTPHHPRDNNNSNPHHDTSTMMNEEEDRTEEHDNSDDEWLMACRCERGKSLVTLLSCLQHVAESPSDQTMTATQGKKGGRSKSKRKTVQPVTVFCTPSGFTFHVFGPAKQSEASIELQKSMFSQFQVRKEDDQQEDWQAGGEFCVNLSTVLESLQLLGPLDHRTSVGLSYNARNEIFKVELLLEGGEVMCTSAIPGLVAPSDDPEGNSLSHAFRSFPVAARMMVRSGILRELLPEWSSVAGASSATVAVSEKRGFEIAIVGHYGECWVQVPAVGDHLVSPLELADRKKVVTRTYPLSSVVSSMKGIEIAEETCININSEGIMAIQHKTEDPNGEGASNFVDFIMTCLEDDEDDEDESQGENDDETNDTASPVAASQPSWQAWNKRQHPVQSPETTTTAGKRRRRRKRRSNDTSDEEDDDSATNHNDENDDDVVLGDSDDMEGEGDSPSQRQQRQSWKHRRAESLSFGESKNDEEEEEYEDPPAVSSVEPLFGNVTRQFSVSTGSGTAKTPIRRRQRRSGSRPQPGRKSKSAPAKTKKRRKHKDEDDDSDRSANMLADSDDAATSEEEEQGESSNEKEEEDEELDITALAETEVGSHDRQGECSSPELVYGN